MSKNLKAEEFLLHVGGNCVERQLKEWDDNFEVNIMKFKDYVFVVKNGEKYYEMTLSEEDVESLKNRSPYALDREIWMELKGQGVAVFDGYGDYLERVLYV
ncbi:hypothetical protein [Lentibacillus sediminis]|uniref:hypothetical protein n=1 Tax=Lentibacillus sediminis TaxID=1940529 RepID=UPI00117A0714|nr:hypothetical protein [Lentibacillus sediminis]